MSRAWLTLLLSLWPVFAGALIYAEVAAYLGSRSALRPLTLLAVVVFALLMVLAYALQPTSCAAQVRPVAYFFVVAWTIAVPLTALSAAAYSLGKIERAVWRHLSLIALSAAVIAVLPIFALWSVCMSGVDCI